MPRYLAIDPGTRRTGLALGDTETRSAGPVGVIEHRSESDLLTGIGQAIGAYAPDGLVVGLPLNADGSIGPAARQSLALIETLRARFNLPVHGHDERLTSFAADQQMSQTGLTHGQKKSRRDALAAANLLSDFLRSGGEAE